MIDFRVLKKCALLIVFIALGGGFLVPVAPAHAAPLTLEKCEALRTEHAKLLADNVKSDLAKGPAWAKANLAEVRLQKIKRLIEVEESIAFRCRGTPLITAVVIPSLADVNQPKQKKTNAGVAVRLPGALRISRVPPPVRRPKRQVSRTTASEVKASPKVVRKAPSKETKESATPRTQTRKVRQVRKKPRRKTTRARAADAYVPPPPNPAYQPSLMSP